MLRKLIKMITLRIEHSILTLTAPPIAHLKLPYTPQESCSFYVFPQVALGRSSRLHCSSPHSRDLTHDNDIVDAGCIKEGINKRLNIPRCGNSSPPKAPTFYSCKHLERPLSG